MMRESLTGTVLLVLCSSVSGLGSVVSTRYEYRIHPLSWYDARSTCRSAGDNSDLAIFYTRADATNWTMTEYYAWVGKYRDHGDTDWTDQECCPGSGVDGCGLFYSGIPWIHMTRRDGCDALYFFICSQGNQNIFVPQTMKWLDALSYCRGSQNDLLTSTNYIQWLASVPPVDFPIWTGLHRKVGKWRWASGMSEYRNWSEAQPSIGNCVTVSSLTREMSTHPCTSAFPYVCFKTNLILVKENKTWEEALQHCRGLGGGHDLISVQPGEDQAYLLHKIEEADTEEVWTGLRFLAGLWLWINEADLNHPDLPVCPPMDNHCGTLIKNDAETLGIRDCSDRRNFLCYKTWP